MVRLAAFIYFLLITIGCTSSFDTVKSISSTGDFNLKVNNKTYNEIQLNWNSVDLAESYTLAYWQNATPPIDCTQGTVINNISNSVTSYTISSLTENKYYSFRICANLKSKSFSTETGSVSTKTTRLVTLTTLYTEKTWSRYIANNGVDIYSASPETTCTDADDGKQLYEKCIHSAEVLKAEILQAPSCSELTIEDSLNVFNWTCRQTNCSGDLCDISFYSSGLKDGKGLRDLITDNPSLGFKDLSVTITNNSEVYAQSEETQLWDNSFSLPPAGNTDNLSSPDTIYVFIQDRATETHELTADGISVVTINGAKITDSGNTTTKLFLNGSANEAWLEVNIDNPAASIYVFSAEKVQIRNTTINGASAGSGIRLQSSPLTLLKNVDIGLDVGSTNDGLSLHSQDRTSLMSVNIKNSGDDGIFVTNSCKDIVFNDVEVSNNASTGINFNSAGTIGSLTLKNIKTYNNGSSGIIAYASQSTFENIETYNNTNNGIAVYRANNIFNNITAHNNGQTAIYQYGSSRNKYFNLKLHFNNKGINIQDSSGENVVHNVIGTNHYYDNVTNGNSPNNTFSRIISSHSRSTGTGPDSKSTFLGLTAVNNGAQNFRIFNTAGATVVNMVSSTATSYGTWIEGAGATNNYFAQSLFYNSGIRVGSENNRFLDHLLIEDPLNDCTVDGGLTAPGLIDSSCTTTGTDGSFNYGTSGPSSDAVLRSGFDISSSFRWLTSIDDQSNQSDVNGVRAFDEITDWASFDSFYKAWGKSGASFPATPGRCETGQDCQIWDYRVLSSDTVARNTTNDGKNQNQDFLPGMACPTAVDGERYIEDQQNFVAFTGDNGVENIGDAIGNDNGICEADDECHNRFLINAFEIVLDNIGDDDGLCESNEACIYMPNYGAYQGEGDYQSQGTCQFQDGTISGVSMYAFPTNGIN